jgi:hypothetical protein
MSKIKTVIELEGKDKSVCVVGYLNGSVKVESGDIEIYLDEALINRIRLEGSQDW